MQGGNVLLLRNERDEWELPGGKLELGEDPADCVVREIGEESGWQVTAGPMPRACRSCASVINALSWSGAGPGTITSSGVKVPLIRGALTPDIGRRENSGAWCIQHESQAGYLPTRCIAV